MPDGDAAALLSARHADQCTAEAQRARRDYLGRPVGVVTRFLGLARRTGRASDPGTGLGPPVPILYALLAAL